MGKNKLRKFAEMETIPFVFQYPYGRLVSEEASCDATKTASDDENCVESCLRAPMTAADVADRSTFPLRGRWHSDFFRNDGPIVLELGCGKGEYTVALARRFP